jgi:hypothetical protein
MPTIPNLSIQGVHGTCASMAAAILAPGSGFRTGPGRFGDGCYFWKSPSLGYCLAKCWYLNQKLNRVYDRQADTDFRALQGRIEIPEDQFIDLDEDLVRTKVERFFADHQDSLLLSSTQNVGRISTFFDQVIQKMEEFLGKSVLVVQKAVPGPGACDCYNRDLLGNPVAFLVRDGSRVDQIVYINS